MAFWIPMALMAGSTIVDTISANKQNSNQYAWNKYNASMAYQNSMFNVKSQAAIGATNAKLAMMAGNFQAGQTLDAAKFNTQQIYKTTLYNDALMENELELMWEAADLDVMQLDNQRARERGEIRASQAASGTVMDMDSNAAVVVDSMTQQALDSFIIRHGADIQAAKINNARAQSFWQGEMQMKKIMYEGQLQSQSQRMSSALQAAGIMAETAVSTAAGTMTAQNQFRSSWHGARNQFSQNKQSITNNFIKGMFGAAAAGTSTYFAQKAPVVPGMGAGGSGSSLAIGGSSHTWGTGYSGNYSLMGSY